jgi:hypothetical protein
MKSLDVENTDLVIFNDFWLTRGAQRGISQHNILWNRSDVDLGSKTHFK